MAAHCTIVCTAVALVIGFLWPKFHICFVDALPPSQLCSQWEVPSLSSPTPLVSSIETFHYQRLGQDIEWTNLSMQHGHSEGQVHPSGHCLLRMALPPSPAPKAHLGLIQPPVSRTIFCGVALVVSSASEACRPWDRAIARLKSTYNEMGGKAVALLPGTVSSFPGCNLFSFLISTWCPSLATSFQLNWIKPLPIVVPVVAIVCELSNFESSREDPFKKYRPNLAAEITSQAAVFKADAQIMEPPPIQTLTIKDDPCSEGVLFPSLGGSTEEGDITHQCTGTDHTIGKHLLVEGMQSCKISVTITS
ncbi:hypothetical protein F5J12DRAFT_782837 [Pisolithus orientalis]|uniref:uncharacterized protein n=1 Tax=Pisolithus orientalis TaxID=936130 RepID=UPI0022252A58|nr:uncharacterized protein F5J12DRAFT_782837 [Pisolithus orientalis]KAI6006572.1 hypothetical protein F5J12DRAFT_782837 [Pisolithus orientalis]